MHVTHNLREASEENHGLLLTYCLIRSYVATLLNRNVEECLCLL